jgi:hypothetical protein
MTMKKLALFAMLLGSTMLYGCGQTANAPKKDATTTPTTESTTEPKKEGEAPKEEPKAGETNTETPPTEPAK